MSAALEVAGEGRAFRGTDPRTGAFVGEEFRVTTPEQLTAAVSSAKAAFPAYTALPPATRAAFLRQIGHELEADREKIVETAALETALPEARVGSELTRTVNQLAMFAQLLESPEWLDARIDLGDATRTPAPKPDVRSMRRGLGPVAVFGASNFPLAFSVAGGDTASALAAGCPVIAKAHPSHPGTSAIVAEAVLRAADVSGMPDGVFAIVFDDGIEVGEALVRHPGIKAVGFTGSRAGGEALTRLAASRPEPIPVYAEMGSVNPVFVMPGAAAARAKDLAEGLHASFTLGVGQFCTNPGVVFVPNEDSANELVDRLTRLTKGTRSSAMLNAKVCQSYVRGQENLERAGAKRLAAGVTGEGPNDGVAGLWEVALADVEADPELLNEVFGPSTLLVKYESVEDLPSAAERLEGQLTATVHAEPFELEAGAPADTLLKVLVDKAGRLIVNQYPTGVEVGPAMVHGGPYPATSDGRSTSVGTRAIERFTRYVAYQNFPEHLLPGPLRQG
ncbi:MAG TPA: aldehyde dehydrogenase (NADP(+)) [Trueperaceae bacterium]